MGNVIQIKRGASAPGSGDLYPYELGYNTANNCLYIGTEGGGVTAIKALTADSATTAGSISGVTASKTEINYLKGVTSAIQTQLNTISNAASTAKSAADSAATAASSAAAAAEAKAPKSHAATGTTYGAATATNYGHAMASSTSPKAAGTAAVGSETAKFARGDHVHPAQTTVSGNAGSATKLETARTFRTNLASTSTASFDGSGNVTPGVTGTLSLGNGGTGATTAAAARTKLGISMIEIKTISSLADGAESALTFSGAVQCVAVIAKRSEGSTKRSNTNFWTPTESGYGSNFYALYQIDSYRSFATFSNSNKTVTIKNDSGATLDYTVIAFLTP